MSYACFIRLVIDTMSPFDQETLSAVFLGRNREREGHHVYIEGGRSAVLRLSSDATAMLSAAARLTFASGKHFCAFARYILLALCGLKGKGKGSMTIVVVVAVGVVVVVVVVMMMMMMMMM